MTRTIRIVFALTVFTGVGILVGGAIKRRRQLEKISENGYETAHDVLYPKTRGSDRKLRYGPVLPG